MKYYYDKRRIEMEALVGLLFCGGVAYYIYIKYTNRDMTNIEVEDSFVYEDEGSGFAPKSDALREIEAKEIAKNIKTHRGLEGLQNKIDALGDKMDEYHFSEKELMYEKTEEKQTIMEMALGYAGSNPYRYYYCEDLTIDTTLAELKMIGKSISVQKYNELNEEIRNVFDVICLEDAENAEEANELAKDYVLSEEEDFRDLVSYRKIIESNETDREKEKKFNRLVKKSEYLMDELGIDPEDDLSPYKQYLEEKILGEKISVLYPMPHARVLVKNGVKTIEDVRALSDEELLALSDIGPKRLLEIRQYLATA